MTARRWQYILFAVVILALVSTPLWAGNYIVRLAITIAMFSALTLSWNFIGGFTGYPSFSTAAFFGLGSYAGALLQGMTLVSFPAVSAMLKQRSLSPTPTTARSSCRRWRWPCSVRWAADRCRAVSAAVVPAAPGPFV